MVDRDFFELLECMIESFLGVHPFHINLELNKTGQTNVHGQFILNANAMDVNLQPLPALTYITIGGIIDLYVFTGPTVQNVIQQYWDVIGVRKEDELYRYSRSFVLIEAANATLLDTWISSMPLGIWYD